MTKRTCVVAADCLCTRMYHEGRRLLSSRDRDGDPRGRT
jgi:hypothetical protein